ncbi:class I SAM-dependent methyltransferase [Pyxidicoccus xibeiensis]|uniref:class I SAM-dependent methyltransferase n=1 Tax=Pyxidicoccus xibeiensis TaxID=2906759 RepID=UPI0020A775CF|nr:class I SAM-dependent methyltransferase [Pyxidicoccus xibeiensis]MCP3137168.1 class I SAM-dependent methyltransferase [Pyxidicoccus xibeiensis]
MSLPRLIFIRVCVAFLELLTRFADLLVLLCRPWLLSPYLGLWLREGLASPYRVRRSFELARLLNTTGQHFNELMYGETPVFTGVWLFRKAGLGKGGRLVDLGAGRGRTLLAARWLGAGARGVELLPGHVLLASGPVAKAGAELVVGDAMHADLQDATHVFTNWTALTPETRVRLVERFRTCRPGTRVLTVTRPVEAEGFTVLSRHRLLFTWGMEHVWIHEYRPPAPT